MNPSAELSLASPVPSAGAAAPLRERLLATPRLACEALQRAINEADLEAALSCFAPDACLVGAEETVAQGEQALAASLSRLIEAGAQVRIELYGVLVAGEIALAHERWQISYRGIPDPRVSQDPCPGLVMRLLEGEWRVAIAAPWGLAASEPLRAISF
jgi:ketosteroid isomerase-like protein